MNEFSECLTSAASGAALGGSVVSAVCAMGDTVVGPVGTFFGATVGAGAGAAVVGAVGSIIGAIGGFLSD